MTIAAGFNCSGPASWDGGVLLCADTEISGTNVNFRERKIFQFNLPQCNANFALAYAGTVAPAKMVIQQIKYKFLNQTGQLTEQAVIDILATELHDFHEKHIFHHPQYRYSDGPQVSLLVAVQDIAQGDVMLFSSSEDFVVREREYACVGAGESFANYLIGPLTYIPVSNLPLKRVLQLATHVLYQVKKYVPGCGGISQYLFIGRNRDFRPVAESRLLPISKYSETFESILAELFYASVDLDMSDSVVSNLLRITEDRIARIRDEQREERDRQQKIMDDLIGKVTQSNAQK